MTSAGLASFAATDNAPLAPSVKILGLNASEPVPVYLEDPRRVICVYCNRRSVRFTLDEQWLSMCSPYCTDDLERRLSETETVRSQPIVQTSEAQPEHTMLETTEDSLGSVTSTQCFISDTCNQGLLPMDQLAPSNFDINMDYFLVQTSPDISDQTFGFPTTSTNNTCDSAVDLTCVSSQSSASTFMTTLMQADL